MTEVIITSSITPNQNRREFLPKAPFFNDMDDSEVITMFNSIVEQDDKNKVKNKKTTLNDKLLSLWALYQMKLEKNNGNT